MAERVLSKAETVERTGMSHTTIRREEKAGRFPRRRQITPAKIGWLESEIDEFLRTRPVGPLVERTRAANAARHGDDKEAAN